MVLPIATLGLETLNSTSSTNDQSGSNAPQPIEQGRLSLDLAGGNGYVHERSLAVQAVINVLKFSYKTDGKNVFL